MASGFESCCRRHDLVRQVEELDRTLADLTEVRRGLKGLLRLSSASRKVLLCPAGCGECPEVEFAGEQVRVGEAGNLAVLTKDEWNVLVDLIRSGTLSKV